MARIRIKYIVFNLATNEVTAFRFKDDLAKYCQVSPNSIREGRVKDCIIKYAEEGVPVNLFKL